MPFLFLPYSMCRHRQSPHVLQPLSSCKRVVYVLKAHGTGGCKKRVTWGWLIAGLVGQCVWRKRSYKWSVLTFTDKIGEVVKIKSKRKQKQTSPTWAACITAEQDTNFECLMSDFESTVQDIATAAVTSFKIYSVCVLMSYLSVSVFWIACPVA